MNGKQEKNYYIHGAHCASCFLVIDETIAKVVSKEDYTIDASSGQVLFTQPPEIEKINEKLKIKGYSINTRREKNTKPLDYLVAILTASGLGLLYLLMEKTNLAHSVSSTNAGFVGAFLVGILASLSSCFAVVGGIVLSLSAEFASLSSFPRIRNSFHLGRIISYAGMGAVIGMLGKLFHINLFSTAVLNGLLGIFMIYVGLQLLGIIRGGGHFSSKLFNKVKNYKSDNLTLMAFMLGAFTFFLPCGFTQSMQLVALRSGNPLYGGLILLSFALGTFPVLYFLSVFPMTQFKNARILHIAFYTMGIFVILLGLISIRACITILEAYL